MFKKAFMPIALLLMIASLAGCAAGPKADGGSREAGANKAPEKISLMLDWYPNAVHSFIYAAQAKGYFAEQGLDVDIRMPADTNDPLKLVAAGKVDLALTYQPQIVMARAENIPVKSLAAIVRHPLNYLMVPESSPIQSPKDLAGKQVGYPSIPLGAALVETMMENDGGDFSSVKMADVGWDLMTAMATGKVDGMIGGFINHERLLLDQEGHPMRVINPVQYGVPDYYELVLAASDKGIQSRLDAYQKFWAAVAKGQQFVTEHPQQGLDVLFAHEDKTFPLDKEVEMISIQILLPLMDAKDKPFGYQEEASWSRVADWLYDRKLIDKTVKVEDVYINILD